MDVTLNAELPPLTSDILIGEMGRLDAKLSPITSEFTGLSGFFATVDMQLPHPLFAAAGGQNMLKGSLTAGSFSGVGKVGAVSGIAGNIAPLTGVLAGNVAGLSSLSGQFSRMRITAEGRIASLSSLNGSLLPVSASFTSCTGNAGAISTKLPKLSATLAAAGGKSGVVRCRLPAIQGAFR